MSYDYITISLYAIVIASGIQCKIAFLKIGLRSIFVIPVAKGISRELLLVEKHPFQPLRGIIFAAVPLAGLTPKIDEEQATWLHLYVRDLTPNLPAEKSNTNSSGCQKDARWTFGFSNQKACEAASLLIAEETSLSSNLLLRVYWVHIFLIVILLIERPFKLEAGLSHRGPSTPYMKTQVKL